MVAMFFKVAKLCQNLFKATYLGRVSVESLIETSVTLNSPIPPGSKYPSLPSHMQIPSQSQSSQLDWQSPAILIAVLGRLETRSLFITKLGFKLRPNSHNISICFRQSRDQGEKEKENKTKKIHQVKHDHTQIKYRTQATDITESGSTQHMLEVSILWQYTGAWIPRLTACPMNIPIGVRPATAHSPYHAGNFTHFPTVDTKFLVTGASRKVQISCRKAEGSLRQGLSAISVISVDPLVCASSGPSSRRIQTDVDASFPARITSKGR
ncbi:hypothetical protein GGR56DRAFT_286145 [Xylariaceae sp. FL0804]|nr:hypothetical protein GGR56DRAFT_286145 [Xylariaceae sp. FL0804]